jgi:hypothetical protein
MFSSKAFRLAGDILNRAAWLLKFSPPLNLAGLVKLSQVKRLREF